MSDDLALLARPLRTADDLDPLLERVGDARIVLLGEASHGTHEYYAWRTAITRRLVQEKGFGFVAVEGDWPDCYHVNRSVRLRPDADAAPRDALLGFDRWPTWIWGAPSATSRWTATTPRRASPPSRTPPSRPARSATTARWCAARTSRGTSATSTWPTPSTGSSTSTAARRWSGSTTPTSGTRGPPTWPPPAWSTSGSSRARHGADDVVLVGFGAHRGSVLAGEAWGAPVRRMPVPPARAGSLEALLHERIGEDALLVFPGHDMPQEVTSRLDHRAIGVVYSPSRERCGNYVPTVLGERYDALLYFEDTPALRPLHGEPDAAGGQATWPYAV